VLAARDGCPSSKLARLGAEEAESMERAANLQLQTKI
jgi:hypothetical protein